MTMETQMHDLKWWQRAVFYQIYPRSFADGNGDGIGDFPGMIARLDYLADLGIDAVWLSPHYPSPLLDCGYDISDYLNVGPEYGSLADFIAFLHGAHARDIRVVLDLVLNHTSDQHPWFLESRSSRNNPKRDWYIWRDGKDGPPNNWASIFGGSAWELDPLTDQYYYHAFLKEQPDLNWRNPEVKAAMWEMVRFWLDLGVDGFRLDAIATIFEHPDLPNHTLPLSTGKIVDATALTMSQYQHLMQFQIMQPGLHELLRELRALTDAYPGDRMLIGEDEDVTFYGSRGDELHLVFNFPLMRARRLTPSHIYTNQAERLAELPAGAWPCNTLGNHDSSRVWSRWGDGTENDAALARLHLALMLTLKGTPFLYNGEEIGMTDLELADIREVRDTTAIKKYHAMIEKRGATPAQALAFAFAETRDRCRSPFQWSDAPNAGFCPPGVTPWLPVNPNYAAGVNVACQQGDPASLLTFYRRMLHLRRAAPALVAGDYRALHPQNKTCLAFLRGGADVGQECLVILNFSSEEQAVVLDLGDVPLRLLFSSRPRTDLPLNLDGLILGPHEVFIAECGATDSCNGNHLAAPPPPGANAPGYQATPRERG